MKATYQALTGHARLKLMHKNTNLAATSRRKMVLEKLTAQLKEGWKPNKDKNCAIGDSALPLTEKDIKRIKNECETLKQRIK